MEESTTNCFAYTPRGCMALSYSGEELTPEICAKCKFRKSILQRQVEKRTKKHSNVNGFYLYFDGINKGFFTSIIEIDKWLEKYFDENNADEYRPANALFDDYNILFINHSIVFKTQEAQNE